MVRDLVPWEGAMSEEADREEIVDTFREVLDQLTPEQLAKLKADLGQLNFLLQRACEDMLGISRKKASALRC